MVVTNFERYLQKKRTAKFFSSKSNEKQKHRFFLSTILFVFGVSKKGNQIQLVLVVAS